MKSNWSIQASFSSIFEDIGLDEVVADVLFVGLPVHPCHVKKAGREAAHVACCRAPTSAEQVQSTDHPRRP